MTMNAQTIKASIANAIASSIANSSVVAVAVYGAVSFAILHGQVGMMNELLDGLAPADRANYGAYMKNLNAEIIDLLVPEDERAGLKLIADKDDISGFSYDKKANAFKINTSTSGKAMFKAIREQVIWYDEEETVSGIVTLEWIVTQISNVAFMTAKDATDATAKAFQGDSFFKSLVKRIIMTEPDDLRAKHDAFTINSMIMDGRYPQSDLDAMYALRMKAKSDKVAASAANDQKTVAPAIEHNESAAG